MKIAVVLIGFLLLSGCAARRAQVAQEENDYCLSIGLVFGTPDYAACRLKLKDSRDIDDQLRRQRMMNLSMQMLSNNR